VGGWEESEMNCYHRVVRTDATRDRMPHIPRAETALQVRKDTHSFTFHTYTHTYQIFSSCCSLFVLYHSGTEAREFQRGVIRRI
jgi:hypothetical protein